MSFPSEDAQLSSYYSSAWRALGVTYIACALIVKLPVVGPLLQDSAKSLGLVKVPARWWKCETCELCGKADEKDPKVPEPAAMKVIWSIQAVVKAIIFVQAYSDNFGVLTIRQAPGDPTHWYLGMATIEEEPGAGCYLFPAPTEEAWNSCKAIQDEMVSGVNLSTVAAWESHNCTDYDIFVLRSAFGSVPYYKSGDQVDVSKADLVAVVGLAMKAASLFLPDGAQLDFLSTAAMSGVSSIKVDSGCFQFDGRVQELALRASWYQYMDDKIAMAFESYVEGYYVSEKIGTIFPTLWNSTPAPIQWFLYCCPALVIAFTYKFDRANLCLVFSATMVFSVSCYLLMFTAAVCAAGFLFMMLLGLVIACFLYVASYYFVLELIGIMPYFQTIHSGFVGSHVQKVNSLLQIWGGIDHCLGLCTDWYDYAMTGQIPLVRAKGLLPVD